MEIITTTPDNLRALVGSEVRAALSEVAPAPPKYLTVAQAAEVLQMTPGGVRKWITSGHLKAYTFGKVTRVRRDELDALLSGTASKAAR